MRPKRKTKQILCLIFACIFTLGTTLLPVYAEDSVDTLEEKTSTLQNELSNLNTELATLSSEISQTAAQLESTAALVEQTKIELADAKAKEAAQYEDMKARIRYMYEAGNTHFLDLLFSSSCIADFLNKTDYFMAISEYDREMLGELAATHKLIAEKEAQLVTEQETLTTLKTSLDAKSTELNSKVTSTSTDLSKYSSELERAKAAQAAAQAALERKIAEEKAALEAAQETMAGNDTSAGSSTSGSDTSGGGSSSGGSSSGGSSSGGSKPPTTEGNGSYNATDEELTLFAAIIEAEAGSRDYEALLAVGSVVMNRIRSPRYPNTLNGVIYQSGQFSPTWNGALDKILKRGPAALCYTAARDALAGKNNIGSCLQFRWVGNTSHTGIIIGDNVFF